MPADLALLYGKASALSPFRRAFWAILAAPDGPQVRPPFPRQRLGLRPPPGLDLPMVTGQQDLRDRAALEGLRPGIVRIFQQSVRKALLRPGFRLSHHPRQQPDAGVQ